jgi:hypothetical protein
MIESFIVKAFQFFDGSISISRSLEISDELLRLIALLEDFDSAIDLRANGNTRLPAIGAEAAIVTINASPHGHGAIDIGTREAAVHRDPINALAKPLSKKAAKRKIALLVGKTRRQAGRMQHSVYPVVGRNQDFWTFLSTPYDL